MRKKNPYPELRNVGMSIGTIFLKSHWTIHIKSHNCRPIWSCNWTEMNRYKFKYSHHKGMLAEEIMRHHRRPDDTALNLLMEGIS